MRDGQATPPAKKDEVVPPPAPAAPAKASPRQAARKNSMNAGFLNNPKKKNR